MSLGAASFDRESRRRRRIKPCLSFHRFLSGLRFLSNKSDSFEVLLPRLSTSSSSSSTLSIDALKKFNCCCCCCCCCWSVSGESERPPAKAGGSSSSPEGMGSLKSCPLFSTSLDLNRKERGWGSHPFCQRETKWRETQTKKQSRHWKPHFGARQQ